MVESDTVTPERFQRVVDVIVAMGEELTLDGALEHIVRAAAEVVGASFAFLGVLDRRSEGRLGTFAVHGVDEQHRSMVGRLPQGITMVSRSLDDPEPVRVADLRDRDDRDDFPTLHPNMSSFMSVPVKAPDKVLGHLYLSNKIDGGEFTETDEELAVAMAAGAGVIIQNARLFEQTERQRRWLAAGAEMTTALLEPISRAGAQRLVVEKARFVAASDIAALLMPDDDGSLRVRAVSGLDEKLVGSTVDEPAFLERVVHGKETVIEAGEGTALRVGPDWPTLAAVQCAPFVSVAGIGALMIGWPTTGPIPESAQDPQHLQAYVSQASLVMQVAHAQDDQARLAVYEDRDRIGRDLHDLVIQRLFAVGLSLEGMTRSVEGPEARSRLDQAVDDLDHTIKDIRRTIFDLGRTVESSALHTDLEQIVDEAAKLLGFEPTFTVRGRLDQVPDNVAANLLLVVREQLSNIVRHAEASSVDVTLDCTRQIELTIRDDGRGHDGVSGGRGLHNMQHRARQLGGVCRIDSAPGHGFEIRWAVPKEQA